MAEKREISKEYAAIGQALIRQRDELRHLESATIIYLESEHEKKRNKKRVLGRTLRSRSTSRTSHI